MSILCQLLGHKPPQSYSDNSSMGGGDYLWADHPYRDGIGRVHLRVYGICPRCGCDYQVGMTHLHKFEKFMHLRDFDDQCPTAATDEGEV